MFANSFSKNIVNIGSVAEIIMWPRYERTTITMLANVTSVTLETVYTFMNLTDASLVITVYTVTVTMKGQIQTRD